MGGSMDDFAHEEQAARAVVNAAAKLGQTLNETGDAIFCPKCDPAALDLANEHLQDFGFKLIQLPSKKRNP